MNESTAQTWRWKEDLASWVYSIPAQSGESASQCLSRAVEQLVENARAFGEVSLIEVATRERGDDAFVLRGQDIDRTTVRDAITSGEQAIRVIASLDLLVKLSAETPDVPLKQAALVFFEIDEHSDTDQSIKMWLSLGVDIYASTSWATNRDNKALASLNGPRLASFLRWIRERLSGVIQYVDVGDYRGHIDENGFL